MNSLEEHFDEMDFIIYEQTYAEERVKTRNPRTDATTPGPIEHEGTPLDFSFLKLQDVGSLVKERPRAGKRIPIPKEEDEEETKKEAGAALAADEKGEGEAKEGKTVQVIRNQAVPQVSNFLQNFSNSLTAQKGGIAGGRKADEGNEEAARKKEMAFTRTCLLLNNN